MSDLPHGWTNATIEQLSGPEGLITDGDWIETKDQDPNGDVRLIQLADIGDGEFRDRSDRFVTSQTVRRLNCTLLEEGDLLIARMPDPLGRACIFPGLGQSAITAVDVFIWRPSPGGPSARWLMHFVNSRDVRARMMEQAGGTTRQRIAGGRVKQLEIPVPPLPEQGRIVTKIDSLSAKSKRARDHVDHIPRLVEKYKQAILAAAYRDAQRCAAEPVPLGAIAVEVRNGLSKKPSDDPSGLPILRISAVRPIKVHLEDIRYYPPTEPVPATALLREGDLLFTRYNGNPDLTAVCGMVRGLKRDTAYPDKLIRVRLSKGADPRFVEIICASSQSRDWLTPHIKTAAGQHGISGADLKRLPVPLPSMSDQRAIIRRVETLLKAIGDLASEATNARKLIGHLDQAVLAKAFRGELLPQDPSDEPASLLLERIRAGRAKPPAVKREATRSRRRQQVGGQGDGRVTTKGQKVSN
jgi:type I restriction enzyme S subunit